MKLRLPLSLISLLIFCCGASVKGEEKTQELFSVDSLSTFTAGSSSYMPFSLSETVMPEATLFTGWADINSSTIIKLASDWGSDWKEKILVTNTDLTLGTQGETTGPKVQAACIDLRSGSGTVGSFTMYSGELALTGGKTGEIPYSMWIAYSATDSVVNVHGGKIMASQPILIGRAAGGHAFLNIHNGAEVWAKKVDLMVNGDTNIKATINLMGGSLILGSGGLTNSTAQSAVNFDKVTQINFGNGTLGSYESWTLASPFTLRLDSSGILLPDGKTSDGSGSLTVETLKDTTLTINTNIEGTGSGKLVKTGKGTLEIRYFKTASFTQDIVLKEGTLRVEWAEALGTKKTITVENATVEDTSYMDFYAIAGTRNVTHGFVVEKGTLDFVRRGIVLQLNNSKESVVKDTGRIIFNDPVLVACYGGWENVPVKLKVEQGGSLIAKDGLYLIRSSIAEVSGTMTVEKSRIEGNASEGLRIGNSNASDYVGALWDNSSVIVKDGGILNVADSKVSMSNGRESGQLHIEAGGQATIWGIEDTGAWGEVHIKGGTLNLGAGGILFHDQSKVDDGSDKLGENYLSDVYFSSGKILITKDSSYDYDGEKEFAAIINADGTTKRAASSYVGNFFLGNKAGQVDPGSVRTIDVASGATFTFKENILGKGGFNKAGAGTLVLETINQYEGDTVVEEGNLYLGLGAALGGGTKLELWEGSVLAGEGGDYLLAKALTLGSVKTGEGLPRSVTLGTESKTGSFSFASLTVKGSVNSLVTNADVTITGAADFASSTFSKSGAGTLSIAGAVTGLTEMDISGGSIIFGSGSTGLDSLTQVNMAAGSGLGLGDQAVTASLNYAGGGALRGASAYNGILTIGSGKVTAQGNTNSQSLALANQASRLEVSGGFFKTGKVEFRLGANNVNTVLVTADSSTVTGKEEGSVDLIFDESYLNSLLQSERTDVFQLFSTGLVYQYGSVQYNQKQIITVTSDNLSSNGTISVERIKTEADLIDSNQGDSLTKYTPKNALTYVGAKEGELVLVGKDAEYFLDPEIPNKNYRLTPGLGTLVYQGLLSGMKDESGVPLTAETGLYILDYGVISRNADLHSTGAVVLTNNGNTYGNGTDVSSCMLTVDLSQGYADQVLVKSGNNMNVNVLGTGKVTISRAVGSTHGGVVCLQAYGDATFDDVSSYTYANDFSLDGGSTLMQAGANSQILTGNIHSMSGNNVLSNVSEKNFVLRGNITQAEAGELSFYVEKALGVITLDGSGSLVDKKERMLESGTVNISGNGTLNLVNGYIANVKTLVINEGTLSVGKDGVFIMGAGGMTGAGSFLLNGGTLKSASSWETDRVITLASGTTSTISTGGANVRLKKGLSGTGNFEKQGTGNLYVYDNPEAEFSGLMDVKQGRLVLLGEMAKARAAVANSSEYQLSGDLTLSSGKGASLEGMIDANNHKVTFGDKTHFYLSVSESEGLAGYIRNADTISIGSETQLHVDVLQDDWLTDTNYTIFSANNGITGADNLDLILENEFAFVDVAMDTSKANEVNLLLSRKGGSSGSIMSDGTNKGAIHAAVAPMVSSTLDGTGTLSGNLLRTMQTVSKMTTEEYDTYLVDMASSASSYYTALSAQVQDMTQHVNSVRNRVELMNPIMYDDWQNGGIYNMWVGGINHYRDVKSDFQSPGYKMDSWGGELGLAIPMSENFMMGAGFAYTSTKTTVKDGWGENEGDTYNVDLFARYRQERWTLTGVLSGGFTNVDFHRTQMIKDQRTLSNSSSDGNQFVGTFEAMYDIYLNEEKSWILQPLVNVTAGRSKLDGLSETGDLKNAGLALGSQSYNMFSAGVGAKIAYEYETEVSDHRGRVELRAMYVNDMGDTDFKVNGQFMGAPGSQFELAGVENESGAALVSVGWIAPISEYGQFFADASCEFRKNQNGVSSTVGFSFQF